MDPLSQILALLRPEAVGWQLFEAHNAWTLRFFPKPEVIVFGQAITGGCDILREDGQDFRVSTGDFMMMASPPPWSMRALGGGPSVDFKALLADPSLLTISGRPQAVTRFIAGHFTFATGMDILAKMMLPIVHVRATDVAAGRLGTLLALLGEEATADRPGRSHMLERLLETILVEVLRQPGLGWDNTKRGLLAGMADPRIGKALRLIHAGTTRALTVSDLAQAAGMSRSAFAARFALIVGTSPIDYLSDWRMTLARQALEANTRSVADIAELAGYQSVSAFSTAFRRLTGMSPTSYTRIAGSPRP